MENLLKIYFLKILGYCEIIIIHSINNCIIQFKRNFIIKMEPREFIRDILQSIHLVNYKNTKIIASIYLRNFTFFKNSLII